MNSDATALPGAEGVVNGSDLPVLDRLRVALRPAELPLPHPRDVREAAARVRDLTNAERAREARALVAQFRDRPAPPADRAALLRASLHAAALAGTAAERERDAADLVALLHRAGHPGQAVAVAEVLLGDDAGSMPAAPSSSAAQPATPRGRRRGAALRPSAEMLTVIRALEGPTRTRRRGPAPSPARAAAGLRAALGALPAVRDELLEDPERELRLRLAQTLEALGDLSGATTLALDVLDLEEDAAASDGEEDPLRSAAGAHAVLARVLGQERPVQAADHAVQALETLQRVEDPPLRIALITALLQAQMAAGDTERAGFTAGRLLSLQRTLGRDEQRIAPLLAVAAQRVQAGRLDAARVPLGQAHALAQEHRDRRARLETARLEASLHEREGDLAASLGALQRMAAAARWLVDDLDTPRAERAEMLRTELSANALALRRALDLGRTGAVHVAAAEIERRARPGAAEDLPPELVWDHLVDARTALLIADGDALARGADGVDAVGYEARRRAVLEAIGQMPPGHDERARYWAAYLDDRHAHLQAERGEHVAALRAARRARDAYAALGMVEDADRVAALLTAQADETPTDEAAPTV